MSGGGPARGAERVPDARPGATEPGADRDTSRHEVGAPDGADRRSGADRAPETAAQPQRRGRVPERLPSRTAIPYESQLFIRMAAFGLVIGVVYWFLTYETAGSVLLVTFGVASGVAALAILAGSLRRPKRAGSTAGAATTSSAETEPVPAPGWAPLLLAIGLGLVAMGGVLGPWLLIAGLLFALAAAWGWLRTAMDETDEARGLARPDPED